MLMVKNLQKSWRTGNRNDSVLKGISFQVAASEFVAMMGPSGSGKSTLLNCISCYIPFEGGTILLGGSELKGLSGDALAKIRNEKLGFVFQDFMLLDGLTVRENILVPRIIRGNSHDEENFPWERILRRRAHSPRKTDIQAERLADQLLSLFGIADIADRYPADISGGERQRTAVARSLINQPLLLLADEPTGNLDSKSGRTVIASFENARQKLGATILMVTHDSFAASFCDRVILLKDGVIYHTLTATPQESRTDFQQRLMELLKKMNEEDEGSPDQNRHRRETQ